MTDYKKLPLQFVFKNKTVMPREISPSSHLVLFVGAAVSLGGACILLVADFLNKKKLQKKLQEKKLNVRASFDLIRESLDKVRTKVNALLLPKKFF